MTVFIAAIASLAAFAGGVVALKFRDKLHIILGFSAGAVIGAALFDLIPEAIEIGWSAFDTEHITSFVAIGFLTYLVLDRIFSFHAHNHDHDGSHDAHDADIVSGKTALEEHGSVSRGFLGAASFCLHSLIDGIAIGFAFQASAEIGAIVGVAVVAHRFSDGINTIGVILKHRGKTNHAIFWLIAVALAPIVGAAITFTLSVSDSALAIMLSVFAGFFLYIGASDLIPEGNHSHSKILTTVMTLLGAGVLYLIVQLAH